VALTANAMSSAKQMFLSEGFDGFVSKPVEIEELERVLKQVLPKSAVIYVDEGEAIPAAAKPEEEPEEEVKKDPVAALKDIGFDTDTGIQYCAGDEDFYKSLVLQFATEFTGKKESMQKFYDEQDWHNYEILVHALKSTSKMIGLMDLSEKAKALEMASKEQNADYITANHDDMMHDYTKISGEILELLGDPSEDGGEQA